MNSGLPWTNLISIQISGPGVPPTAAPSPSRRLLMIKQTYKKATWWPWSVYEASSDNRKDAALYQGCPGIAEYTVDNLIMHEVGPLVWLCIMRCYERSNNYIIVVKNARTPPFMTRHPTTTSSIRARWHDCRKAARTTSTIALLLIEVANKNN